MTAARDFRYPPRPMTPLARYVLETVITLFAVAGLAVALLYGVRRIGVGRPTGPLELLGRLALDARKAVYLVRLGDTVYVLGASEAGVTKLGEMPRAALGGHAEQALGVPASAGFRDVLERVIHRPTAQTPPEPGERGPSDR